MIRKTSRHPNSQVACPTCVAEAGERCVTKENRSFQAECDAHPARVRAAKRQVSEKLAAEIKRKGEAKVVREQRRYASTNPDTAGFVDALKRLCRSHGVYIKLGPGSHLGLDGYIEDNLQSLDKLNVKEKRNGN